MFIRTSLRSDLCRLWLVAFAIVAVISGVASGQQVSDVYKGVNLWTVKFKVIVKTKCDKFCTIRSEETTEGQPDWVINYSIYREFGGGYWLSGPVAGEGMPKTSLPDISGTNPPTPAQIRDVMIDASKYVGWQYPGQGATAGKNAPDLYAKINDQYDLTGKTQECTKSSYEILKTAKFDMPLIMKYAFADLALNVTTNHYNINLNILPANPGPAANLVEVKTSETSRSEDPSEKSVDSKNSATTEPLSSYLNNSEKSVKTPNLEIQGGMQQGTNEINVCRQENVKNFEFYSPYVAEDVEKHKTVVVSIALTIIKGFESLSPSNACN